MYFVEAERVLDSIDCELRDLLIYANLTTVLEVGCS